MTNLYILGTGTPEPGAARFGTSFVVESNGEHLMFDCGPATTYKLARAGLRPNQVTSVFFTHHHFDHDVDLPCFLLSRWDQSISDDPPLKLYGPKPTTELCNNIIGNGGMFWHDISARINSLGSQTVFKERGGSLPRTPPKVDSRDIQAGDTLVTSNCTVRTSRALHAQPWLDSIAYRLETYDGSIVFLGDTRRCPEVVELAQGCDVLIAPCWDDQDKMTGERAIFGSRDAAALADEVGAKSLVLVHSVEGIDDPTTYQKVACETNEIFGPKAVVGSEGMVLGLTKDVEGFRVLRTNFPHPVSIQHDNDI